MTNMKKRKQKKLSAPEKLEWNFKGIFTVDFEFQTTGLNVASRGQDFFVKKKKSPI